MATSSPPSNWGTWYKRCSTTNIVRPALPEPPDRPARLTPPAPFWGVTMTAMMLLFSLLMLFLAPSQQPDRRSPGGPGANDELTLDGARPIMDNARVTVWDFTWTRG